MSQLRIQKNDSPVDFLMCVPLRGKFVSKINLNLSVKLYVLLLHQQKRSPKKLEIFFSTNYLFILGGKSSSLGGVEKSLMLSGASTR